MEPRTLKRWVAVAITIALVVLVGGGWWQWSRTRYSGPGADLRPAAWAVKPIVPAGTRIRVEVLNASTVRGLARRATLYLRDLGFDVVRYTGDSARQDTSVVIDRSGHPEWAALLSQAMGGVAVQSKPDSSRYVDLTLLVGASWRPPAKALYP